MTSWAHGLIVCLCSEGGVTVWARGLTSSLYFGHGHTASRGQQWKAQWNMGGAPGESSCRKMSKSLVRRGEAEKEKSAS
jgi:hypothetical protein